MTSPSLDFDIAYFKVLNGVFILPLLLSLPLVATYHVAPDIIVGK
jgi:hypothetical protein